MKKKVVIVDDHPIVRQGFVQLINQEADLIVIGEAEDASTALELILKDKPDIALIDLSLKDSNGIELIKDLKLQYPDFPVLVVSLHDEAVYAERVIRAGARGFIMKAEATQRVMEAIRQVLQGNIYLSENVRAKILDKVARGKEVQNTGPMDTLSDRELEVFQLIGEGCRTRDIASKLSLSVKTIETYKAHIKTKLNLKDGLELTQTAIEWVLQEHKRV